LNYVEFHLGDHTRDTAHLSMLEEGALRRLLDLYYSRELPIPADLQAAYRLVRATSKVEREAVAAVLAEFFMLNEDGWHQNRCDREIDRYRDKQRKAKASADARWSAQRLQSECNANASGDTLRTHCEGNALQSPVTRHQSPKRRRAKALTSAGKLPPCPTESVIALYEEILPELPKVRLVNGPRKRVIAKTWEWVLTSTRRDDKSRRAENAEDALNWFRSFFESARANDFLMGRTPRNAKHANWRCDLEFLLSDKGLSQVIEKTE
jgi:uncharacterized protein YdaU (DUF1376 family)